MAGDGGIRCLPFDVSIRLKLEAEILLVTDRHAFQAARLYRQQFDVGRIGDDPFAYVASVKPFHDNTLAVYCKDSDAPPDQVDLGSCGSRLAF